MATGLQHTSWRKRIKAKWRWEATCGYCSSRFKRKSYSCVRRGDVLAGFYYRTSKIYSVIIIVSYIMLYVSVYDLRVSWLIPFPEYNGCVEESFGRPNIYLDCAQIINRDGCRWNFSLGTWPCCWSRNTLWLDPPQLSSLLILMEFSVQFQ